MNNDTKINLINSLINEITSYRCNFDVYPAISRKMIDNIYNRAINIADEINYPNNNQKLALIGYLTGYPFNDDNKWLIAKDKLEIFLSDMLNYLQADGNGQANFWNLVHKDLVEVSMRKFENGHYADAVESAFKTINKRVKDIVIAKTKKEIDGVSLMREAFGFNSTRNKDPIIFLGDITTESGKNIQEGYMQLFAGAMQGIRNPKAHDNIDISKERAMHQIFVASLLMYKLDEGKT